MWKEERATEKATAVIDAILEMMAAHGAVWRHGSTLDGAKAMREKAIKALAEALSWSAIA